MFGLDSLMEKQKNTSDEIHSEANLLAARSVGVCSKNKNFLISKTHKFSKKIKSLKNRQDRTVDNVESVDIYTALIITNKAKQAGKKEQLQTEITQ